MKMNHAYYKLDAAHNQHEGYKIEEKAAEFALVFAQVYCWKHFI